MLWSRVVENDASRGRRDELALTLTLTFSAAEAGVMPCKAWEDIWEGRTIDSMVTGCGVGPLDEMNDVKGVVDGTVGQQMLCFKDLDEGRG